MSTELVTSPMQSPKKVQIELGNESDFSQSRTQLTQLTSRSFRLSAAFKLETTLSGSLHDIWNRTNAIVGLCLGPGKLLSVALYVVVLLNSLANISMGFAGSALILMFFGDMRTSVTASTLSATFLIYALILAVLTIIRALIEHRAGTWFVRRAKFAINKMTDVEDHGGAQEVMLHLTVVKNLFIKSWVSNTSNVVTEIVSIGLIGFWSLSLMGIAFALFCVAKVFSASDDYSMIKSQSRLHEIANAAAAGEINVESMEVSRRFFHNETTLMHLFVKLSQLLFAYTAPVIFFFIATSMSAKSELSLSAAMSCLIFYLLAVSCHIQQHGTTAHVIRNLYHADRLLKMDQDAGGIFKYFSENPSASIPYSAKKSSSNTTATHIEKAGFVFTVVAIIFISVASTMLLSDVELSCVPVEVTCSQVPADGSNVAMSVDATFSFKQGCVVTKSISSILEECLDAITLEENSDGEEIEFDSLETDAFAADVLAELDAVEDFQSAADASPISQVTDTRVISASYKTWMSKQSFQQTFKVSSDSSGGVGRKLGDDSTTHSVGVASSSTPADSKQGRPTELTIELTVGDGRYDGSKNSISISLMDNDSGVETEFFDLGDKWARGEKRSLSISTADPIANIGVITLVSGGKDAVKFVQVIIKNSVGEFTGGMTKFLKCRGSKRKGTWNCAMDIPMTFVAAGSDYDASCPMEYCEYDPEVEAAVDSNDLSDYTAIGNVSELKYPFGSVFNDCSSNAAVRFSYTATCDGGCAERSHTFKLSPELYFSEASMGNPAGPDNDKGCQQKNGDSYPKYCLDSGIAVPVDGSCTKVVEHDRGHQIPANNFDDDEEVCGQTNYMTNIMPQAAQMNRGAWLKTEMLAECWRQIQPLTVIGGAVFFGDGTGSMPTDWEGIDRTNWFVESHYVKNPAYYWKIVYAKETDDYSGVSIAWWIPNHESAIASDIDKYVVSISELETLLSEFDASENFSGSLWEGVPESEKTWLDPATCSRA